MRSYKTVLLAVALVAGAAVSAARAAAPAPLTLTWLGQSGFVLKTPGGATVLMDPIPGTIGYPLPKEKIPADVVTITHEHPDHVNVDLAKPGAKVLRGLANEGKDWATISETVKDVKITSVPTFHDAEQGAKRGKNAVFVFEVAGLRVVHLGDLGHELSKEQLAAIGKPDVLLIPTGGHFTIDAEQAAKVVAQLEPKRVVVPMHHRTAGSKIEQLAPVDGFLARMPKDRVRKEAGPLTLAASDPDGPGFDVVLLPAP